MRKFYLDIDGTRTDLNGISGILFHSPAGLGVTFATTYADISDGFSTYTDTKQKQATVTGTLTFLSAAYTSYKSFADSILTAQSLKLIYAPDGTEYTADVRINFLTKSESVAGKFISIPTSFTLLSPWYTEETLTGTGSVSVTAGGQMETGIVVTTSTALVDPSVVITSGAVEIARADLTYTTTGEFEYSNLPSDSHITDDGADIIQYADISKPVFGRTRSAFTVTLTGAALTVLVRKYWRTV